MALQRARPALSAQPHPKKGKDVLSRWLLVTYAVEALLLLVLGESVMGQAIPIFDVVLGSCAVFLVFNACLTVVAHAILRRASAPFAPAVHQGRTWRCELGELLALFTLYVLIQPFERCWMGRETTARVAPGHLPILLVHGYLCNRGLWWWLRRHLRARQFSVATVNLEPPLAGLDRLVTQLGERVETLLAQTGAKKVLLVSHSMGGLLCRAYVQGPGATRTAGLVTLATPHHGTQIARHGWGRNAREMQPDSAWLRSLNARPAPPVPIANIWSRDDEIVAPTDSCRLLGAAETTLHGLGHLAIVFSPTVLACVEAQIARLISAK
jgi:triacylglycerol lipase